MAVTRRSLFAAAMAASLPQLTEAKPMADHKHFTAFCYSIPHPGQDYPTCGNWRLGPSATSVYVSQLPDRRYEFLVAIHELIEAELCRFRGIGEEEVTAWDKQFEEDRAADLTRMEKAFDDVERDAGRDDEIDQLGSAMRDLAAVEPGDHPGAPYHREHVFATRIERLLAEELGVDWNAYSAAIEALK
jgi:hypothetical protein